MNNSTETPITDEMVIWKYQIDTTDTQKILMPDGAEILTVQIQGGVPCLWAYLNPNNTNTNRKIEVFGTGKPIPEGKRKYIGTYQLIAYFLVFHVFENLDQ